MKGTILLHQPKEMRLDQVHITKNGLIIEVVATSSTKLRPIKRQRVRPCRIFATSQTGVACSLDKKYGEMMACVLAFCLRSTYTWN